MKKAACILGVILAIVLLALGLITRTPSRENIHQDVCKYVGGDAFNYIIEASLRGGEIAGARTAKAVYFSASALLFILSLWLYTPDENTNSFRPITPPPQYKAAQKHGIKSNVQEDEVHDPYSMYASYPYTPDGRFDGANAPSKQPADTVEGAEEKQATPAHEDPADQAQEDKEQEKIAKQ